MTRSTDLNQIAKLAAKILAGKNEHLLSHDESALVKLLEANHYLVANRPPNGYVGRAQIPN
jgi:uncharacterized membrane-anchored protein